MKKTKRFLAVVLCMLLMLTPLAVVAETVTVQAAGPQTVKVKLDKKTGKRYGYDENNQKVTQQRVSVIISEKTELLIRLIRIWLVSMVF